MNSLDNWWTVNAIFGQFISKCLHIIYVFLFQGFCSLIEMLNRDEWNREYHRSAYKRSQSWWWIWSSEGCTDLYFASNVMFLIYVVLSFTGSSPDLLFPLFLILGKVTFMYLADAFIQSDLQCIQAIHVFVSMCSLGIEPTTFWNVLDVKWSTL